MRKHHKQKSISDPLISVQSDLWNLLSCIMYSTLKDHLLLITTTQSSLVDMQRCFFLQYKMWPLEVCDPDMSDFCLSLILCMCCCCVYMSVCITCLLSFIIWVCVFVCVQKLFVLCMSCFNQLMHFTPQMYCRINRCPQTTILYPWWQDCIFNSQAVSLMARL